MRKTALFIVVASLALGACSKSGTPLSGPSGSSSATPAGGDLVEVTGPAGQKPIIKIVSKDAPTMLVTKDVIEGSGAEVKAGATVTIHYVGVRFSDGGQFDASWDRGQPAQFPLPNLIPAWQQGIPGMKPGGRRLLVVPPALGYGAAGAGTDIPPNATLVFVVDLISSP